MLDYPDDPAEFGARIRELTDGNGVAAVYDGVGASTFDASLASLAVRGTLALFGAASGPVPPFDPQRLNSGGLAVPDPARRWRTTPARADEFSWRAGELLDAIADGDHHRHRQRALPRWRMPRKAHRDLQGRKTVGSVALVP